MGGWGLGRGGNDLGLDVEGKERKGCGGVGVLERTIEIKS